MLVAIGGHSRNIGKTSVVAGIISALPEFGWTAMKITQHGHGICSVNSEPCDCATEYDHPYVISEENDPHLRGDSARFLAAGAKRALWLRTAAGQLGVAIPELRAILARDRHLIVESNSILQFFRPNVYVSVLDYAVSDFKETALRYLDRADAVITVNDQLGEPAWRDVSKKLWHSKPRFPVVPPPFISADFVQWLRLRLAGYGPGECLE
jgi:hypothetical protein